jgi:phosphoenolpyruvate synthase/pyruvate phosphate dikinase
VSFESLHLHIQCVSSPKAANHIAPRQGELLLPEWLIEDITGAFSPDLPLAVRSSAVLEGLPDASFAGRYITRLNVNGPAALERAVLDCWLSYINANAPGDPKKDGMSVLVQPIRPACAATI